MQAYCKDISKEKYKIKGKFSLMYPTYICNQIVRWRSSLNILSAFCEYIHICGRGVHKLFKKSIFYKLLLPFNDTPWKYINIQIDLPSF